MSHVWEKGALPKVLQIQDKIRQTQVHGLQAQVGNDTGQSSAYYTSLELPEQHWNQPALFHHIQSYHIKSINDTSSKHIKPLWLSAEHG